jgi:TRAP-type mannitol/chloroaromatic compound transport system permease small subunit
VGGFLLLMQAIAEATRCIICIRTGVWPKRLKDVQETETMMLHEKEDEAMLKGEGK